MGVAGPLAAHSATRRAGGKLVARNVLTGKDRPLAHVASRGISCLLMCGIVGAVWNDASKAVERETLQRMIDVLRHCGPCPLERLLPGQPLFPR